MSWVGRVGSGCLATTLVDHNESGITLTVGGNHLTQDRQVGRQKRALVRLWLPCRGQHHHHTYIYTCMPQSNTLLSVLQRSLQKASTRRAPAPGGPALVACRCPVAAQFLGSALGQRIRHGELQDEHMVPGFSRVTSSKEPWASPET